MEALTGPQDPVDDMREAFRERRDFIVKGLNAVPGISCRASNGAFYAFANVSELPLSSKELESRLLEDAGVATPASSSRRLSNSLDESGNSLTLAKA